MEVGEEGECGGGSGGVDDYVEVSLEVTVTMWRWIWRCQLLCGGGSGSVNDYVEVGLEVSSVISL